jgi:DNA processing protein
VLAVGVVSGLAVGIDAVSHNIALQNNAKTVGVIGSGLDQKSFYPSQNWHIRNKIIESGGCVLSEYAPGRLPNIYTFPQRNRILAALTDLTWVVQASLKSGSLITALQARELGKTLATTPADIRNKSFDGNLKLLKEGCQIVSEAQDIISLLGLKSHPEIQANKTIQFGSDDEKKLYEVLTIQPQNVENIAKSCKMLVTEVSGHLTMLELSGLALSVGSNEWIRV